MKTAELLKQHLTATYNDTLSSVVDLLPELLVALVLITLAWLVAKALQIGLRAVLEGESGRFMVSNSTLIEQVAAIGDRSNNQR